MAAQEWERWLVGNTHEVDGGLRMYNQTPRLFIVTAMKRTAVTSMVCGYLSMSLWCRKVIDFGSPCSGGFGHFELDNATSEF